MNTHPQENTLAEVDCEIGEALIELTPQELESVAGGPQIINDGLMP